MKNVWNGLDHEHIFSAVEKALGTELRGLFIQRNSYINRVYEVERADNKERLIIKFYRPGRWTKEQVLEEHSFLKALMSKDVPVICPIEIKGSTLFSLDGINFCVFPKKGGRSVDEFDKEAWQNIGRHLSRMHIEGAKHKNSKRIVWRPSKATKHHLDVLLSSGLMPPEFKVSVQSTAEAFIKRYDALFEDSSLILIHGDCHKGNLISRPNEGIFLIDFDDMCMGPAVQDLWMLLPGSVDDHRQELGWFLEGYGTFRQFDVPSLKLIPALRCMRLIHYAAWLSVQKDDPHFDRHFSEARAPKYWNELVKEMQGIVYGKNGDMP
ncbi:MAG: serine/threonine protein kinase [bacterium]